MGDRPENLICQIEEEEDEKKNNKKKIRQVKWQVNTEISIWIPWNTGIL
jgi:hypothetical protein